MKTRYKQPLFPLKTALFCCPTAWSRWTHVHQEIRKINQGMKGRRGKPLHGCPVLMGWYAEIFCMFKITFSWSSALKSWIKQSWIASSTLEDLPEGLQVEAGERRKDIPWLLHWLWNQTSIPKLEWIQQHYFMSHIQGVLLCILRVWAFYPRNKWWQCSLCIQG